MTKRHKAEGRKETETVNLTANPPKINLWGVKNPARELAQTNKDAEGR